MSVEFNLSEQDQLMVTQSIDLYRRIRRATTEAARNNGNGATFVDRAFQHTLDVNNPLCQYLVSLLGTPSLTAKTSWKEQYATVAPLYTGNYAPLSINSRPPEEIINVLTGVLARFNTSDPEELKQAIYEKYLLPNFLRPEDDGYIIDPELLVFVPYSTGLPYAGVLREFVHQTRSTLQYPNLGFTLVPVVCNYNSDDFVLPKEVTLSNETTPQPLTQLMKQTELVAIMDDSKLDGGNPSAIQTGRTRSYLAYCLGDDWGRKLLSVN